jgi:L-lactate dehydrogenase complex protein LldG
MTGWARTETTRARASRTGLDQSDGARAEILGRIRAARAGAESPALPAPVPRDYHGAGTQRRHNLADQLAGRLADYGASVLRCRPGDAAAVIGAALAERGARRVAIPDGLPTQWAAAVAVPLPESQVSGRASLTDLGTADAVLTTVTATSRATGCGSRHCPG